ncbi:MAG: ABC transporter ATP-binding protein [Geminocystis sp.]|nr:ABC transporter ATP-binding protein [Geminocystis sp.]MCS7147231.1 ABC transporter ATP-binding protein [Geminocystis sp.]MCX8078544.1 ABC transporter ATP-binding protein [Geminocystis sp.]MDW8462781.1 ABC transporter ATP-binding protein [Geminocystis sp.]HIK37690.1 ABC transporter ATP-binding protein [Geminocystis sp. M7585_C2015_104]
MARVKIENLYKTYSEQKINSPDNPELSQNSSWVLKGINLDIQDGEFMVLVGPSGCGKSTLLRLIAGLESVTAGKIWIDEVCVNDLPPKARNVAMVFQNYALYPHMRVYDNIAFGLRRMNKEKLPPESWQDKFLSLITSFLPSQWRYVSAKEKAISARVMEVAKMLQIEHLLDRMPKQLSGGQKQRVALGRAIARNPKVFLMDEPLSNLDAKLRTETRLQILQLQRQLGVTTIYVTHDQTEAMTMGDRIAVINKGEIQQIATPMSVYRQPVNTFVAQFIGSPPMNLLELKYERPNLLIHPCFKIELTPQWQQVLANYNYEKIWLGIRPESFYLSQNSEGAIPVIIRLIEPLGAEVILTVTVAEDSDMLLQVKLFEDYSFRIGDKLNLGIRMEQISLFDYYQKKNVELM